MFASKLHHDIGILTIRVGVGATFMVHGFPKLAGGPDTWMQIGKAISHVGIEQFFTFFGFMAATSEFIGGLFLIIGLMMRQASFLMCCTMVVATFMHLGLGDPFKVYSHPLKMAIVFLGLMLIGPGRISLDKVFHPYEVEDKSDNS